MNIKGRMNRATYFSGLALIVVLLVVLRAPGATGALLAMMFGISVARLHDTGRSGKWALAPLLMALAALFLPFVSLLGTVGSGVKVLIGVVELAAPLLVMGTAAWLGTLPGQPDDNRFGPPPEPGVAMFRSRPRSQVG